MSDFRRHIMKCFQNEPLPDYSEYTYVSNFRGTDYVDHQECAPNNYTHIYVNGVYVAGKENATRSTPIAFYHNANDVITVRFKNTRSGLTRNNTYVTSLDTRKIKCDAFTIYATKPYHLTSITFYNKFETFVGTQKNSLLSFHLNNERTIIKYFGGYILDLEGMAFNITFNRSFEGALYFDFGSTFIFNWSIETVKNIYLYGKGTVPTSSEYFENLLGSLPMCNDGSCYIRILASGEARTTISNIAASDRKSTR